MDVVDKHAQVTTCKVNKVKSGRQVSTRLGCVLKINFGEDWQRLCCQYSLTCEGSILDIVRSLLVPVDSLFLRYFLTNQNTAARAKTPPTELPAAMATMLIPLEQASTPTNSAFAALHPDCSGKSTSIRLPWMEVTVPTLEYVTSPQPYFGSDTDGRTLTRLPTCRGCEHSDDEEEVMELQAVAPATPHGQRGQLARVYGRPTSAHDDFKITFPCIYLQF